MTSRLKRIRKVLKVNQTNFAKQLGLTQTAYSMIENGINPLSDRYIKVICSSYNINEIWLRTGEGEMFFSSPYEKEFIEIFSHLTPETQEYLLLMAKELLNTQQKLLNTNRTVNNNITVPIPDTPEELEKLYPPVDMNENEIVRKK